MSDFAIMRHNMVNGQLLPEGVTRTSVLEAFLTIPREKFVPRQFARIAYMDAPISFHRDRSLLRPATLARLFEALDITPQSRVLYVACGTGYGPAILSHMGAYVVALDAEESLTQEAERLLQELGLLSGKVVLGPLTEGWSAGAPYDIIIIEGCVDVIPPPLIAQLRLGGSLVTFKSCQDTQTKAIRYVRNQGVLTEIPLFDASAPHLKEFQQKERFVFE